MSIKINREIAGDLNNPTTELLNYCISQHQKELRRLEKLSNYYDGEQEIINRTKDNAAAPNNKVMVNHAKYVVDMNVGFMVGNPIAYTSSDAIEPILEAYTKVDIVSHDTELEKDLSVFGVGYELIKALPHYFKTVPVIEYRNNEERQGDFEQAISLIDAYNLLQSDRLNDKEAFVDAILFIRGFELQDGDGEKLASEKMLQTTAPPAEVDASYLTKTMDEGGIAILRDSLLEDIHKVTYIPNMNDKQFSGNVSGEAMKYKLFGLLQLMSVKSRYMVKGLRQRLEIFANFLKISDNSVDIDGVKIKLKPNLPINTTDIVAQIVQAHQAGILPLKVLLTWLPDIDNVDEVLEQLQAEKEEAIELNQKAMGTQAEDSHSDLEDDERNPDDNSKVQEEE